MHITLFDNQGNNHYILPLCCVPPRIIRLALSILGIGICFSGIAIASIGLSSLPMTSFPWWFSKMITVLGTKGCIGLIFASYILGTLITELGRDPLQRSMRVSNENISPCQNMIEIATRIPRIILSTLLDAILLLPYGSFVAYRRLKPATSLDDLSIRSDRSDKAFIVLIHGMNSNSGIWDFGKHFLNKQRYGQVITIKLEENDSVITDNSKGLEDYAQTVIDMLSAINDQLNGEAQFILIGHSMGGLVAAHAAEYLADDAQVLINHIFTIGAPWWGSPLFDIIPNRIKPKRFRQMTEGNAALTALANKVAKSNRFYYTFGSTTDVMVPAHYASIDPNRPCTRYTCLGHLSIVALPFTWWRLCAHLDKIYFENESS